MSSYEPHKFERYLIAGHPMGNDESKSLGIPTDFVHNFGESLRPVVSIRGDDGKIWPVKVVSYNPNYSKFEDGWSDIFEHYGATDHCTLRFTYVGESQFHLEIQRPLIQQSMLKGIKCQDNLRGVKKLPLSITKGKSVQRGDCQFIKKLSKAYDAANKMVCNCPSFVKFLSPSHVSDIKLLGVPKKFHEEHIQRGHWLLMLTYDSNPVVSGTVSKWGVDCRITRGWGEFVDRFKLKVGDALVFQEKFLKFEWDVTIFRGDDYAQPGDSDEEADEEMEG